MNWITRWLMFSVQAKVNLTSLSWSRQVRLCGDATEHVWSSNRQFINECFRHQPRQKNNRQRIVFNAKIYGRHKPRASWRASLPANSATNMVSPANFCVPVTTSGNVPITAPAPRHTKTDSSHLSTHALKGRTNMDKSCSSQRWIRHVRVRIC